MVKRIGVPSPGYRESLKKIMVGVSILQDAGLEVMLGDETRNSRPRVNSPFVQEEARFQELLRMLQDDSLDAIWLCNGGAGTYLMLPRLEAYFNLWDARGDSFRKKPIIGFSDATFLLLAASKHGFPAWSAPLVTSEDPDEQKDLAHCARRVRYILENLENVGCSSGLEGEYVDVYQEGEAQGLLYAGTFSCLNQMLDTRFVPDFSNSILLTEEHGFDTPGQVEYLFWFFSQRLLLSPALANVSGFVFGDIETVGPYPEHDDFFAPIGDIIYEVFPRLTTGPICSGLSYDTSVVPLGVPAQLTVKNGKCSLEFDGYYPKKSHD